MCRAPALPPKADTKSQDQRVRFGPIADINRRPRNRLAFRPLLHRHRSLALVDADHSRRDLFASFRCLISSMAFTPLGHSENGREARRSPVIYCQFTDCLNNSVSMSMYLRVAIKKLKCCGI
jgi:hypothetical protein